MTNKDESTPEVEQTDNNAKKTNAKKKQDKNKKILVDLVEESSVDKLSLIMDLSKNGLLDQYRDELELRKIGVPIKPSITEIEFKKIIGD